MMSDISNHHGNANQTTIMSYHLTPFQSGYRQEEETAGAGEDVRRGPLHVVCGNAN